MLSHINALDTGLYQFINLKLGVESLDALMLAISGRMIWLVPGIVLLAFGLIKRSQMLVSFCLMLGLALGATDFFTYNVLKPTFQRERPCHQEIEHRLVQSRCGSDWGFPSNHAANGGATVASAAWQIRHPLIIVALGLIALAVGISRVYLGVHFPGDILAGYLVGALCATLVYWLVRRLFRAINKERWVNSRR